MTTPSPPPDSGDAALSGIEDLIDLFADADDEDNENAPVVLEEPSEDDESDGESEDLSLASDHGDEVIEPPQPPDAPTSASASTVEQHHKKRRRRRQGPYTRGGRRPFEEEELDLKAPASYLRIMQDFCMGMWLARQAVKEGHVTTLFRGDCYTYNVRGDFVTYVLMRQDGETRGHLDAYVDVRGGTAMRTGIGKLRSRADIAVFFGQPPADAHNAGRVCSVKTEEGGC